MSKPSVEPIRAFRVSADWANDDFYVESTLLGYIVQIDKGFKILYNFGHDVSEKTYNTIKELLEDEPSLTEKEIEIIDYEIEKLINPSIIVQVGDNTNKLEYEKKKLKEFMKEHHELCKKIKKEVDKIHEITDNWYNPKNEWY